MKARIYAHDLLKIVAELRPVSVKTIVDLTGLTRSDVWERFDKFVKKGVLAVVEKASTHPGGGRRANFYDLGPAWSISYLQPIQNRTAWRDDLVRKHIRKGGSGVITPPTYRAQLAREALAKR